VFAPGIEFKSQPMPGFHEKCEGKSGTKETDAALFHSCRPVRLRIDN
jgi:hypothetical protein